MDLFLDIDSDLYEPFVTKYKKGKNLLIVKLLNTIYETMVASLLYHNTFVKALKRTGFKLNIYDPCVVNHLINDNQKKICFHFDEWKLSHQDREVNDKFIDTLRDKYESVFEDGSVKIKLSRKKLHD